jgi:hypothetical protein
MTSKKLTNKVSFRLDDETWIKLESAAHEAGLKPNDWVRELTMETLTGGSALSPHRRLCFEQFVRTQYLVANGFQLLAENKLTGDEWKKFRAAAKEKIDEITSRAMADFQSRRRNNSRRVGPLLRD